MKIINTISDLRNLVDGWDASGDLSSEQIEKASGEIRDRAHNAGLTYGDDWEAFLNSLTFDEILTMAE
jgi:hypothetical protein